MNSDDLSRAALEELNVAVRYKNMCKELLEHLINSVRYLQWYSEKYNIPLPKEDAILRSTDRAADLIEQMSTNRKFTERRSTDDYTEPALRFCKLSGSLFSL